jgi:thioredoxin 2
MRSNLNFMFALLVVILIVTVALASRGCGGKRVPAFIDPLVTLDEAITRSGQSGRPVFALVGADWCEPCTSFKHGTLTSSRVVAFLKENTEPVYIDVTRSDRNDADALAMMSRLGVREIPTVILMRRGQIIGSVIGDVPAGDFLKWLQETVKPAPK